MRFLSILFFGFNVLFCDENTALQIFKIKHDIDIFYAVFMVFSFIIFLFMVRFLRKEFKNINAIKTQNKMLYDIKNENFIASQNSSNILNFNFKQKEYNSHNTVTSINLFSVLDYASNAIFEYSFKNKSIIVFDFDDKLDKKYNINHKYFMKVLISCIKFFIQECEKKTILVEFLCVNQGVGAINFRLKITSNEILNSNLYERLKVAMEQKNALNIGKFSHIYTINECLENLGWSMKSENSDAFKIMFDGFLKLSNEEQNLDEIYTDKFKNLSSVIICNNTVLRSVVVKQAEKFQMDIKFCSNWKILNDHVKDAIYLPFIVFIYIDDYNQISDEIYQSLKENKEKKKFIVVFLIGNTKQIKNSLKIGDFFITTPYVLNTFKKVLDLSYERAGGGGIEASIL